MSSGEMHVNQLEIQKYSENLLLQTTNWSSVCHEKL